PPRRARCARRGPAPRFPPRRTSTAAARKRSSAYPTPASSLDGDAGDEQVADVPIDGPLRHLQRLGQLARRAAASAGRCERACPLAACSSPGAGSCASAPDSVLSGEIVLG